LSLLNIPRIKYSTFMGGHMKTNPNLNPSPNPNVGVAMWACPK